MSAPVPVSKSDPTAPGPKSQSPEAQQSSILAHEHAVAKLARESKPCAPQGSDQREKSSSGGSRVALLIAVAAIIGGAWFFLRQKDEPPAKLPQQELKAEPAQLPRDLTKPAVATPEPAKVEPGPAPTVSDAAPTPSAAASDAPTAPAAVAAEPSPSDGLIVVTVTTIPPEARFFYKGKPVGRSPFRVELKPGQRRSFEIGCRGYSARKVVVDGTKKDMTVAMRPVAPTAPATPSAQ